MGHSYTYYHYCSSECGPNKGWWPKSVVFPSKDNPKILDVQQLLYCPKEYGGCGRKLRVTNRDINRFDKANKAKYVNKKVTD